MYLILNLIFMMLPQFLQIINVQIIIASIAPIPSKLIVIELLSILVPH